MGTSRLSAKQRYSAAEAACTRGRADPAPCPDDDCALGRRAGSPLHLKDGELLLRLGVAKLQDGLLHRGLSSAANPSSRQSPPTETWGDIFQDRLDDMGVVIDTKLIGHGQQQRVGLRDGFVLL